MSMAEYAIIRARQGQICPRPLAENTEEPPVPDRRKRDDSEDLSPSSDEHLLS